MPTIAKSRTKELRERAEFLASVMPDGCSIKFLGPTEIMGWEFKENGQFVGSITSDFRNINLEVEDVPDWIVDLAKKIEDWMEHKTLDIFNIHIIPK